LQRTLIPDVDVECAFCGYRSDAEGAAILYLGNVLGETLMLAWKDGNDYPLYWCPNCVNNALIGLESGGFLCFACGFEYEHGKLRVCGLCRGANDPDGFVGDMCEDCYSGYVARDNS